MRVYAGPPLLNGRCTSLLRAPVSEMTYTVLSGTLVYHTIMYSYRVQKNCLHILSAHAYYCRYSNCRYFLNCANCPMSIHYYWVSLRKYNSLTATALPSLIFAKLVLSTSWFSALTLLVGHQEGHELDSDLTVAVAANVFL